MVLILFSNHGENSGKWPKIHSFTSSNLVSSQYPCLSLVYPSLYCYSWESFGYGTSVRWLHTASITWVVLSCQVRNRNDHIYSLYSSDRNPFIPSDIRHSSCSTLQIVINPTQLVGVQKEAIIYYSCTCMYKSISSKRYTFRNIFPGICSRRLCIQDDEYQPRPLLPLGFSVAYRILNMTSSLWNTW